MVKRLRILNVEDSELDAALMTRHLTSAGYTLISERVDTADAMQSALAKKEWDIILCDYSMPGFNAVEALAVLHESDKDIPFIIISGTVGEEIAVEAMLTGANDYLPKDNLTRLIPAIERELHEAENRKAQRQAEKERRVIFEIIQGIIATPSLADFLKLAHHSIKQIVYAENCFVMLLDPIADIVHFEFWADKHDSHPEPRPTGKGFASYVLRTGKPLLVTEETKRKMKERGEAEVIGTSSASWLGVPLRTASRTIGVLALQHYEDESAYTQRDLEFLSSVGDQIALAIERNRAEKALRDSEERYRDLIENAIDIIYVHDLAGNYVSVNRAGEKITGYSKDEILTMNMAQTIAPEYLEKAQEMMAAKLAGKEVTAYELEVFARDGRRIALEVNTRLICENGIPVGVQGIARDTTKRKQLEDQFRQSQRMEAIGVLAGGIAHDFNNLLTAISGYGELTLKKMSADDPLRHNIEEIKDAGDRAAALTGRLLAFSRRQGLKPGVHNLNRIITELEKMLCRVINESIEIQTELDPNLGNIQADPGQLEQVIMNLAVNARDAMPNGGKLMIKTENVFFDGKNGPQHLRLNPGPFVKMTVTDTGEGIDERIQRRIFEPFFTTKAVGKGTGLGLSTVYGIVEQSGGDIAMQSTIGQGTSFEIYLPLVDQIAQKPKWAGRIDEDFSGTETVLLVEDDEIVRNLIREILTGNGYKILQASSGKAALAICTTQSEPIHMLLTDLVMPEMNGTELKDQVVKLRPDIRPLVMSGYTDDVVAWQGILDSQTAFIEKPFTPEGLARKVREVLES